MIKYEVKVYEDGSKYWYLNGKYHREDGPAIEWANGGKQWYLNDQLHREDGPAIEFANGTKYWYLKGQRHREDGPAVEYADGHKFWYLKGKRISEREFLSQSIKEMTLADVVEELGYDIKIIRNSDMENLTNMKQVDSQIAFDKKMTLLISVLGSAIGAGCVVFSINVLLG